MRTLIFLLILALLPVYGCGGRATKSVDKQPYTEPEHIEDDVDNEGGGVIDGKTVMINVYMTKYKKVISMPFEEYVKGVVAAEMPAAFESEALKAQAVAARTYALSRLKEFAGTGCSQHKGADICTNPAHCQAYTEKEDMRKAWGKNTDYYWERVSDAVEGTKGMVAMYEDLLIDPVFHAISGGRTENSEDVWRSKIPYLRSVSSPYEQEASKFSSSKEFSKLEFIRILRNNISGLRLNPIAMQSGIKILSHTAGGRVKAMKIGNKVISGQAFQGFMGLNSNNFTLRIDRNSVIINVKGYGHGAGMSQYGANGLAKHGYNYIGILKHYYYGIEVTDMWHVLEN